MKKYNFISFAMLLFAMFAFFACKPTPPEPEPTEKVAMPTITPEAGLYNTVLDISIITEVEGASIHYTTDGSNPTEESKTYAGPFTIEESSTVKAIATKSGFLNSDIVTAEYIINTELPIVPNPTFTPEGGTYTEVQRVTITCEDNYAQIYYTTDGSNPNDSTSTIYQGGAIVVGENCTIKARAYRYNHAPSEIVSAEYVIDLPELLKPTIFPGGGTYTDPVSVRIINNEPDAVVRYTTDGSEPTESSSIFYNPFTITSTTTVKAKAFKQHYMPSETVTEDFVIEDLLTGSFSISHEGNTNTYEISNCLKKDVSDGFIISFKTIDANTYFDLKFYTNRIPTGTLDFVANANMISGSVHENSNLLNVTTGSITITHIQTNEYIFKIDQAIVVTTNTLVPIEKKLQFNYEGIIINSK